MGDFAYLFSSSMSWVGSPETYAADALFSALLNMVGLLISVGVVGWLLIVYVCEWSVRRRVSFLVSFLRN